jgi:amino acid transporter
MLAGAPDTVILRRSLTLVHAVLYGMGVTIGAGIYVLVGTAAARTGMLAPLAFVAAAILMALTAASFAELGGRMPVAAGEAAYVGEGFRSDRLPWWAFWWLASLSWRPLLSALGAQATSPYSWLCPHRSSSPLSC